MNKLDYAQFDLSDYEDSPYKRYLVMWADRCYQLYCSGKIQNSQYGSEVLAGCDEVGNYFEKHLTDDMRKDPNFAVLLDDLMLFVDENNAKLMSWALVK
jgi:hypothetical protein